VVALTAACGSNAKEAGDGASGSTTPAVRVATARAREVPLVRTLAVSGSLRADEQAEVGSEAAGRVVETPIERGTRVDTGTVLVRLSSVEAEAQVREAEANVAQIRARLGLDPSQGFEPSRVPEVRNAKAALDLATAEYERIAALVAQQVVSRSEHDQRRAQVEAAREQYQASLNAAQQSFESLQSAGARLTLARKALADTTLRAPFAGQVVERRVSVGDYVTRGTVVATVVRVDPLRLELTVPEQHVGLVAKDQAVSFRVDAYADRTFEARVRYVSPSLRADQRALVVEAVVPNADGALKPGLFATARLQQTEAPGLVVPAAAVQTAGGISRVFLVHDGRIEERIVTLGTVSYDDVEIVNGLAPGDLVAVSALPQLSDGLTVDAAPPAS
jgi:RND family efflux transporter MFP subunit